MMVSHINRTSKAETHFQRRERLPSQSPRTNRNIVYLTFIGIALVAVNKTACIMYGYRAKTHQ